MKKFTLFIALLVLCMILSAYASQTAAPPASSAAEAASLQR
ncbi:MAG: hypothetical protein AB1916_07940 [Thermodesulfobacteriota bacterium]